LSTISASFLPHDVRLRNSVSCEAEKLPPLSRITNLPVNATYFHNFADVGNAEILTQRQSTYDDDNVLVLWKNWQNWGKFLPPRCDLHVLIRLREITEKPFHIMGLFFRTGNKIIPALGCYGVGARSSGWSMEEALR